MSIPKRNKVAFAAGVAVLCALPALADVITVIGIETPVGAARVAQMPLAPDAAARGLARQPVEAQAMLARSFEDARLALTAARAPVTRGTLDALPEAMLADLRRALGGREAMLVPMGEGLFGAFIGSESQREGFRERIAALLGEEFGPRSAYGEKGALLFVERAGTGSAVQLFPISAEAMAAAEAQPVAETVSDADARARMAALGLSMPEDARGFHLTRAGEGTETLSFSAGSPPRDIARAMARDLGQDGTFEMGLPNGRVVQTWRASGPVSILALDRETPEGRGATVVVQYSGASR